MMRKMMKNQLVFFTNKAKLERHIPPSVSFPVKKYGQKYSSAPNSPLPLMEFIQKKTTFQTSTTLTLSPPVKKLKNDEGIGNSQSYSNSSNNKEQLCMLECIYVHLNAAVEYEIENQIVSKELDKTWSRGVQEPYQLVRTLTKKAGELMDLLEPNLDAKYWSIVVKSANTAGDIYEAFYSDQKYEGVFNFTETGIEFLVEKAVSLLMQNDVPNVIRI
jgi:hypothetical protein